MGSVRRRVVGAIIAAVDLGAASGSSSPMSGSWQIDRIGAGAPSVLVHVPHAGVAIPAGVRSQLLLDDGALAAELAAMTDWHTDRLAAEAAATAAVPVVTFINRLSRLVVDPERFPDEREVMEAVGMGAVYRRTSGLDPLRTVDADRDAALRRAYFDPYAAALADLVDEVLAESGRCVIVDLHSYPTAPLPYELDPTAARPPICIGTDDRHTPAALRASVAAAFATGVSGTAPTEVAIDTPFAGTYVPLRQFGTDPRVTSVMIEIRRDQYLVEPSTPAEPGWSRTVAGLVRALRAADASPRCDPWPAGDA